MKEMRLNMMKVAIAIASLGMLVVALIGFVRGYPVLSLSSVSVFIIISTLSIIRWGFVPGKR
jgi:hypothetical protein